MKSNKNELFKLNYSNELDKNDKTQSFADEMENFSWNLVMMMIVMVKLEVNKKITFTVVQLSTVRDLIPDPSYQ